MEVCLSQLVVRDSFICLEYLLSRENVWGKGNLFVWFKFNMFDEGRRGGGERMKVFLGQQVVLSSQVCLGGFNKLGRYMGEGSLFVKFVYKRYIQQIIVFKLLVI